MATTATTIVLIEGVAELAWLGDCWQPVILRKGGYEARNPATGEVIVVSDKMVTHEHYSSDIKASIKYVARVLAEQDHKASRVSLKEWLDTIEKHASAMTAALRPVKG